MKATSTAMDGWRCAKDSEEWEKENQKENEEMKSEYKLSSLEVRNAVMRARKRVSTYGKRKRLELLAYAKSVAYPDQTHGSKLAARIRKEANKLTKSEREKLQREGMEIIQNGTP